MAALSFESPELEAAVVESHDPFAGSLVFAEGEGAAEGDGAEQGEGAPEIDAAVIFGRLLPGAEIGVIAILLPVPVVIADRLDMAFGGGAEPGVPIGGRKADAVQPVDLVPVRDPLALRVEILPVPATPLPRDPGRRVAPERPTTAGPASSPARGGTASCRSGR